MYFEMENVGFMEVFLSQIMILYFVVVLYYDCENSSFFILNEWQSFSEFFFILGMRIYENVKFKCCILFSVVYE